MRTQLLDQAAVGRLGNVAEAIPREVTAPRCLSAHHARRSRFGDADLGHVLGRIEASASESEALKTSLECLRERYLGAAILEVGNGSVVVWGGGGSAADVSGLHQFVVRVDEASTVGFLATEAALVCGCPGSSATDRRLAQLVAGKEDAFGLSLSIVVGGRVRYLLYGCVPWLERGIAERELEVIGEELSRTLGRFERDAQWWSESSTPVGIAYDEAVAVSSSRSHN